ncbi:unnamed protein product [Soboliphyme baturini]|uniref:WD_REPEATS_REGION domain-containing protein n=1 Tax=Soboliphyme baturini TaxID=241478 RepID=A0A183J5I7_9BILA|nr:unnamed protein product [Soboliphyme baturini]
MYSSENNVLVGLQDGKVIVWCCPSIAFIEKDIAPLAVIEKSDSNIEKTHQILGINRCQICVRRIDGCVLYYSVATFLWSLYEFCSKDQWSSAVRLCRLANLDHLWATLACLSLQRKNFCVAETAYAELNQIVKLKFIKRCRSITDGVQLSAEAMLLSGDINGAEQIYLHNKLILQAVMLNIIYQQWEHALDLAMRYEKYQAIVIGFRQQYLEENNCSESIAKFLEINDEVSLLGHLTASLHPKDFCLEQATKLQLPDRRDGERVLATCRLCLFAATSGKR